MEATRAIRELAVELARAAGRLQRERYETPLEVSTKSGPIDLVTEVDRACEALIVDALQRERPGDSILAEEGGATEGQESEWLWIVDPLDGTTNFAHGYPGFCVSIGVERAGARSVGVVYDPLRDELFHAERGAGAYRNGVPIRVSQEAQLGRAMLATGFAYDLRRSRDDNLDHFAALLKRTQALRRGGSAAMDLCYVACGRLDGYWELKLHPWDVAAGILIVEEAGGRVSDCGGGPPPRSGREIVATNGRIHPALLEVLGRGGRR